MFQDHIMSLPLPQRKQALDQILNNLRAQNVQDVLPVFQALRDCWPEITPLKTEQDWMLFVAWARVHEKAQHPIIKQIVRPQNASPPFMRTG